LAFEKALHEQETAALDLNQRSIQYNVLAREVESDRLLYDAVVQRLKETSLTKELQPDKIRIVQPAIVPKLPFKPETTKVLVQGLIGGLAFGLMLALFLHSLETSLKSVDEAESYLKLPVLSVIPQVKVTRPGKSHLVVADDAKSSGAESFRSLRTSLSMLGREEERRVFLLTSALPQEGKTFCSLNYAASLGQTGLRTVLIDCDLRRPSVEKILTGTRSQKPGVTDFLTGKAKLPDIIQATGIENFSFISSGTTAPNPGELLTRNSIDSLVEDALQQFQRVVIDSAPIHAVSDTLLILNRVQTVCIVGRACKTPRKSILRALQLLQKVRAPIAGIILNRMPRRRGLEYYYDHYYDYSYRGKYSEKRVYGEV
jgi:succinoglycan biosynthesis transport protein ExoP